ncbi:2-keto-4-pentenoate hydratase [Salinibacterium sp. ZJ450]|uniref:2-keto-4-pentenoate hydratase n=1 Tax=Salinibacterium sp. ZJ450 TaxID=2708338 RepID=UPI001423EC76|nr:fumarylacetoacetate hydrolase family protein [Salinibacterium sp. ZJ450]
MNDTDIADLGDTLLAAYDSREPVRPLTEAHPDLRIEDAYRVQLHQVEHWKNSGRRVAGYKVGLTSLAMQRQLGVDQPDFGHVFSDMILDGTAIDAGAFISPKIEPEISFVLKHDLRGPGLSVADVIGAVDYAIASLEIIDSRVADWKITLSDTVADNASSGALVLGTRPVRLDVADLGLAGCVLVKNGDVVATGAGAAVLGHPLNGVLWLANMLGSLGQTLEAGSVVMAGSITAAIPVAPGDVVTATFAHLGSVSARFSPASKETAA